MPHYRNADGIKRRWYKSNTGFAFFIISRVYVFESICIFDTGLYTMQEPTYLSKIVLETICLEMVLTQIIIRVYKDSITFTYPTKSNIWLY